MELYVIKIGSHVLTAEGGKLNKKVISHLIRDVDKLKKAGKSIVIVSSGAVNSGRKYKNLRGDFKIAPYDLDAKLLREQILSSVGQPHLMAEYIKLFKKYGLICSQHLVTRADFANHESYRNMKVAILNLISLGITPIFNENDFLCPEELDFSDNDQLACVVAAMLGAKMLLILSNIDGVYNKNPKDKEAKIIPLINDPLKMSREIVFEKSKLGRGGMDSKLMSADLITSLGIPMRIANGFIKGISARIILGGKDIGTYFPVRREKQSEYKRWLAVSASPVGSITVSTYLADLLRQKTCSSVLLSGIETINGPFKEKDVVAVFDETGKKLGIGKIKYESKDLKKLVEEYKKKGERTKEGGKIAIHYDYFVFQ